MTHPAPIHQIYRVSDYFRPKLSPTSGRCLQRLIFFKNLFYQNNCKEAMNIEGGQIRGAHFNFFAVKKYLSCIFWTLPSVSKITPESGHLRETILISFCISGSHMTELGVCEERNTSFCCSDVLFQKKSKQGRVIELRGISSGQSSKEKRNFQG